MNRPLEDLLPTVNDILLRNNEETMFISLFAGILNTKTGRLRYVNAGHNPIFWALGGNAFEMLPMPRGSLLGVAEDIDFSIGEKQLQPGDVLFMYTDGVTEATREGEEVFGEARLLEALNRSSKSGMQELVSSVDHSIATFISDASQYDDITILSLKYLGP